MIDTQILRDSPELVKEAILKKGIKNFDFDLLVSLDREKLSLLQEIELLRKRRNDLSSEIPKATDNLKESLLAEASIVKEKLKLLEDKYTEIEDKFNQLFFRVPNIMSEKTPEGSSEDQNVVLKGWSKRSGEVFDLSLRDSDFVDRKNISYLDHIDLGKMLGVIDVEKSAKVSGSRFCYLLGDLVLIQDAISMMLKKELLTRGFTPIIPPLLVRERALFGTSHFPEGRDQVYKIENEFVEEGNSLYLVGSSEPVNFSFFSGTTFDKQDLPKKFFAQTPCFRSEVGSWGRDVKGIKRVHQFDKLEMNAITTEENAESVFEEFQEINEWLLRKLELPYRIVEKCHGDSGYNASFYQRDIEIYRNATKEWMEFGTNTNTSNFQSRRLNIKYKEANQSKFAFTLNDTGIAFGRVLLALLEHHQEGDGSVIVPSCLKEWVGKERLVRRT